MTDTTVTKVVETTKSDDKPTIVVVQPAPKPEPPPAETVIINTK